MTEGELIEISQRRRALEDVIERVDLNLLADIETCQRKIDRAEEAHKRDPNYRAYCDRVNEPMAGKLAFEKLREDLERSAELCREDMNRLMDEARKATA